MMTKEEAYAAYCDKFGEVPLPYGFPRDPQQSVWIEIKKAIEGTRGPITHEELGYPSDVDI